MYKILTFNLPNFQDRVIQGSGTRGNVGTYKAESLPNIKGKFGNALSTGNQANGCFYEDIHTAGVNYDTSPIALARTEYFDASLSSFTYQDNASVQPNALLIQCCIKY